MIPDEVTRRDPGLFTTIQLSEHTTWGIGGSCTAARPRTPEELASVLCSLEGESIPWTVLGRGSNTLAPTRGWRGVVVMLAGGFRNYSFRGNTLVAGGAAPLPSMAGAACSNDLAGIEFAVGIPGTAGGGLCMNAGAYGSCIGDVVESVSVFDPVEGSMEIDGAGCLFGYRTSAFQKGRRVVTEVRLRLARGNGTLRARAAELLALRREKFPLDMPNAGSVFRRPLNGPSPGKLIEDCGLKGKILGKAMVSPVHANFIVNLGGATSDDVLGLMELVAERVLRETGFQLFPEVKILGEAE